MYRYTRQKSDTSHELRLRLPVILNLTDIPELRFSSALEDGLIGLDIP